MQKDRSQSQSLSRPSSRSPQHDMLGFDSLMGFRNSMDHLFEDFFSSNSPAVHSPKCNVYEDKGNFHIELQVPGMSEKDLDVSLDGHVLQIKGEASFDSKADDKNYHRVEFSHMAINRAWELPPNVNVEKLQANFKNGILDICIPKHKGSEVSKKIEIQSH